MLTVCIKNGQKATNKIDNVQNKDIQRNTMNKKKKTRIIVSLIFSIFFIYAAPLIPTVSESFEWYLIATVLLLGIGALIEKDWPDFILAGFIATILIGGRIYFNEVESTIYTLRATGILTFFLLHITLLIGPWSRMSKPIQKLYAHRRHIGVVAFLLILIHIRLILKLYFNSSLQTALTSTFVFFGFTAFIIMVWLAITSWDKIQKIGLTWWAFFHTVLLLLFLGLTFIWLQTGIDIQLWHKWVSALFFVFWILVHPLTIPQKIFKRVNGWKQLHRLIYIVYIAIIIHIWIGTLSSLNIQWLNTLFWVMVIAVIWSHIMGYLKKFTKKNVSHRTLKIAGSTYAKTDFVSSFEEGKGRRFEINKIPIAVFLHKGKFIAMNATCAHQGGPLDEGEIIDGYVVCPWHKYEFSIKDGTAPDGFKDCVPYYKTHIEEKIVYVAVQDTGNCCIKNGQYTTK